MNSWSKSKNTCEPDLSMYKVSFWSILFDVIPEFVHEIGQKKIKFYPELLQKKKKYEKYFF